MTPAGLRLVCFGCGAEPTGPHPFACPNRGRGDDVDHVVRRVLPPIGEPDRRHNHPYLRYRKRLASWHRARSAGWSDEEFVNTVKRLDAAVAEVDGRGFRPAPVVGLPLAAQALGVRHVEALVTAGDVSGSHKARHLFGLALHLLVAGGGPRELAIASCGNAALAAAVVARALGWPLRVFIPTDAPEAVVERLYELRATVQVCPRDPAVPGDPTYHAFRQAVATGALPFCCQGPDNGLTIEGGMTLGYRWAEYWSAQGQVPDHLFIQVGGGALGSAVGAALREAHAAGCIPRLPQIHVVQTHGAWPMKRALERLVRADASVPQAVQIRGAFMWPWETPPHSLAHGILDDETYDWAALAEHVRATGGQGVLAAEPPLLRAQALAKLAGVPSCVTGAAGLAGAFSTPWLFQPQDRLAVILSGRDRSTA